MSKIAWTDPTTLKDYLLEPSPLYEEVSSLGYVPTTTSSGTGSRVFTTLGSPIPVVYHPHRDQIITDLIQEGYWVKATGSRVTKDGWTDKSDWDYVVYDPDKNLADKLAKERWELGYSGNGAPGIDFLSFKQNNVNLILVFQDSVWKKYIIATNLLRMMNPKTKKERIAIFDSVFEKDVNSKAVEF
jgi:hypothetical protein